VLKTVLESLEGVDDAVQPFYVENDGKFILQIEGVDDHPDVANLKGAYTRTKADRDAVKTRLSEYEQKLKTIPEDFDADTWKKLKEGNGDAAKASAQMIELRKTLEAERDEWKAKYETKEQEIQRVAVERSLDEAIQASGITEPIYVKAARALLASQVKVEGEKVVVDTDMGPMALPDYVKRWAAGDGKSFVSPPKGGDAKGNERGSGGGKTVSAKELEGMAPQAKAKFFADNPGITVTD
jgi:hypothetical protein